MRKVILSFASVLLVSGALGQNAEKKTTLKARAVAKPIIGARKIQLNDNQSSVNKTIHKCATDEVMERYFQENPQARQSYIDAQKSMGAWSNDIPASANKNAGPNSVMNTVYALDTIPVVFHILHQGGPENIPNQVIYDALAQINIDYQKMDPDTAQINAHFQSRAYACNLTFQLATIDPNGNCTNGIIRHYDANTIWDQTQMTNYAYTGTASGKWDPRKYLNVYVVKSITDGSGSTGGGTIVGYTYIPGTWSSGSAYDAIVYNCNFLGVANKDVRSLAHEMGHWFGLRHTFGSTNNPGVSCGDDNLGSISGQPIDDTPKTVGFFSTCPAQTPNSCDTSNWANVENIMDYSSCPKMFTYGQVQRMRYTLTQTTAGRNNLVTAANKVATGIRNSQICAPIADFSADKRNVCTNSPIVFSDSTTNSITTSFNWDFPGGSPSTSTASNPSITYASPGTYAVTYTATNASGSDVISKTNYVTVYDVNATNQNPWVESFESITIPNSDWTVANGNGGVTWQQDNALGYTGTNSVMIDNFNNANPGSVEILYSPSYNIAGIVAQNPGATFTFKLAHQRRTTASTEKLQVYSSVNCGTTWALRYSKAGSSLATVSAGNTAAFVPSGSSDWRTDNVSITALSSQTNVMFKFVFTSDAAGDNNNIYIDDINISNGSVSIKEMTEALANINVYPNPSFGVVNLSFDVQGNQMVKLELLDVLGRVIETPVNKQLNEGSHVFTFGADQKLDSGVYFSRLTINGNSITKKIVIE